jgi:hypothetical protein
MKKIGIKKTCFEENKEEMPKSEKKMEKELNLSNSRRFFPSEEEEKEEIFNDE